MVDDVKQELLKLLPRLIGSKNESEQDDLFEQISSLSPDPSWSDYVFHSRKYETENGEIKVEEVVEKIMSYSATLL